MRRRSQFPVAVLSFALAVALAGCSAPRHSDNNPGVIVLQIRLIDAEGNSMVVDTPVYGIAQLGSIPGTVFGSPQPPFTNVAFGPHLSLEVDFKRLQAIGAQSTTMTSQGTAFGWKIVPADTRFSRVSTTIGFQGSTGNVSRVGFEDAVSKNVLLLVFFDRPCHLTGTIVTPPRAGEVSKHVFDVTIDRPGFHWLVVEGDQAHDSAVVHHAKPSVQPAYRAQY